MVEYNQELNRIAPPDRTVRKMRLFIEKYAAQNAKMNVFTTKSALSIFVERHGCDRRRTAVISNGFNEELFSNIEAEGHGGVSKRSKIKIVHMDLFTLLRIGILQSSLLRSTNFVKKAA